MHMKLLGIDYGKKRIGLATATRESDMAFPLRTVPGGRDAVGRIAAIAREEGANAIVIGESTDFSGKDNLIMRDIRAFAETLGARAEMPVHYQKEFLSSAQAAREQGADADIDASAAAIILQAYIDTHRP